MTDLKELGKDLKRRRRELRIPSGELANYLGVSQSYIWLIEKAKERPNGEPSRPSKDKLMRWIKALRMSDDETQRLLELAGYLDGDSGRIVISEDAQVPRTPDGPASAPITRFKAEREAEISPSSHVPYVLTPKVGARLSHDAESRLVEQMVALLRGADRHGQTSEATHLLDSYLQWLDTHLKRERDKI